MGPRDRAYVPPTLGGRWDRCCPNLSGRPTGPGGTPESVPDDAAIRIPPGHSFPWESVGSRCFDSVPRRSVVIKLASSEARNIRHPRETRRHLVLVQASPQSGPARRRRVRTRTPSARRHEPEFAPPHISVMIRRRNDPPGGRRKIDRHALSGGGCVAGSPADRPKALVDTHPGGDHRSGQAEAR